MHPRLTPVVLWILACLVLVCTMIGVGGTTRLTESGLSIVEWKLVSGIFPPLSAEAWDEEFSAYQTSPQYEKVNRGMSVEEFRSIYWLEYLHRLLGRVVGMVFLIPLLFFWWRGMLSSELKKKMSLATFLVALQGAIGWYMVQSGLVQEEPAVSHYRLALHLGMAFLLIALLVHVLYRTQGERIVLLPLQRFQVSLPRFSFAVCLAVFLQVLMGALVAGLDAGRTYNTFPFMDGDFIPRGILALTPWPRNFLENIPAVQFQHRWIAFLVLTMIICQHIMIMLASPRDKILRHLSTATLAVVGVQIALGIATLLHAVPVALAVLHQMVAVVLFGFCVLLNQRIRGRHEYTEGTAEKPR